LRIKLVGCVDDLRAVGMQDQWIGNGVGWDEGGEDVKEHSQFVGGRLSFSNFRGRVMRR
jgi:hypothetical protein